MLQKESKKQITISAVMIAIVTLILVLTEIFISQRTSAMQIQNSENELLYTAQLHNDMIKKQVYEDFQTLRTLAAYVETAANTTEEELIQGLSQANLSNNFIRMGYISLNGTGTFVELDGTSFQCDVSLEDPFFQKVLTQNAAVSDIRLDDWSHEQVVLYAVPFYQNGKVNGILTATHDIQIFSSIVNQAVYNGTGFLHIINHKGDFVVRATYELLDESIDNVFDDPNFTEAQKEEALNAMANQTSTTLEVSINKTLYEIAFLPVQVNDWYVLCVIPKDSLISSFQALTTIFHIVFLVIFAFIFLLFFHIYRIIMKNSRAITQLAYYDSLTGASNWNYFLLTMEDLLSDTQNSYLATLNINHFKMFNELFGRKTGDELLCYIKSICVEKLNSKEIFCRENADHFVLYLQSSHPDLLIQRIQSLLADIEKFPNIIGQNYKLSCSCGIIPLTNPKNKEDLAIQVSRTIYALSVAKEQHENPIVFFDQKMLQDAQLKNRIESCMELALQNHHFKMLLQPKVDLHTEKICGAEALVRWITSAGSTIYPDQFIPVFEQNGFCAKLDLYMLEEACRQLRQWINRGITPFPISVNQSKLLFYQKDYRERLLAITQKYQISPHLIILEITEGLAVNNAEEFQMIIAGLHEDGFRVSMDDFGSGYSSLNTLQAFSIDELKLDRAFLAETNRQIIPRRNLILKHIFHLAKELNIETVAEGIETSEQEAFARSLGCDVGQGFYYSKPIFPEELVQKYQLESVE